MREVLLDGSVAAARVLLRALEDALAGEPVVPLGEPGLRERCGVAEAVAEGTAVVVVTSGSTGDPKGVEISGGALRASAEGTHRRLGGAGRWLMALPGQHIAGVQVLVRSILAGLDPVIMATAGGFRAEAFVEAAATMGPGRRYTALVPTQLARLLEGAALDALRSFDAVLLGGAAPPGALLARARAAGVRVVTTYGMTETAGGCVYDGVPLDGVRVRIGAGDRIELGGPTLATGYRLRPQETAEAFVDGWFRTGDLGRLGADGTLEVLGRADDVINTGGVKVAAAAVERVLAAQPGVAGACVVGLPDSEWGQRIVAAVVADGADGDTLRGAVRAELGAAAVPKTIRFVEALPLRGPGKVDRAAVADLF